MKKILGVMLSMGLLMSSAYASNLNYKMQRAYNLDMGMHSKLKHNCQMRQSNNNVPINYPMGG